jgi:hypothetical protein
MYSLLNCNYDTADYTLKMARQLGEASFLSTDNSLLDNATQFSGRAEYSHVTAFLGGPDKAKLLTDSWTYPLKINSTLKLGPENPAFF